MVASGFGLVKPVHLTSLLKRYRQLLGEARHWARRLPPDDPKVLSLTKATASMEETLNVFEIDFSTAKPIAFRPPQVLGNAALHRAVLTALRKATSALPTGEIARIIANTHGITFANDGEESRFIAQVDRTIKRFVQRKLVILVHPLMWQLTS